MRCDRPTVLSSGVMYRKMTVVYIFDCKYVELTQIDWNSEQRVSNVQWFCGTMKQMSFPKISVKAGFLLNIFAIKFHIFPLK